MSLMVGAVVACLGYMCNMSLPYLSSPASFDFTSGFCLFGLKMPQETESVLHPVSSRPVRSVSRQQMDA